MTEGRSIGEVVRSGSHIALLAIGMAACGRGAPAQSQFIPGSVENLPRYRSECVISMQLPSSLDSWDDILAYGQDIGLTEEDVTVPELVAFNGLQPGTPPQNMLAVDVCVDERDHGRVGFYGDVPDSFQNVRDILTPPAIATQAAAIATLTPNYEVKPQPTPRPTDVVVYDNTLEVVEEAPIDVDTCQVQSSYKLDINIPGVLAEQGKTLGGLCSDTLVEGGYHVTNAHCVGITTYGDTSYNLIDENHQSAASYTLQHNDGSQLQVVGGDFSFYDDVAVLYTLGSSAPSCIELGSVHDMNYLDPMQFVNYQNYAQDPQRFRGRFLGQHPENERIFVFIDGIDAAIEGDGTSRNESFYYGGSGGSSVGIRSARYIGTTSNLVPRTDKLHVKLARHFNVDSRQFVRFGFFRSADQIAGVIRAPYPRASDTAYAPQRRSPYDEARYAIEGPLRMFLGYAGARE